MGKKSFVRKLAAQVKEVSITKNTTNPLNLAGTPGRIPEYPDRTKSKPGNLVRKLD
jgi:hypothetical protein